MDLYVADSKNNNNNRREFIPEITHHIQNNIIKHIVISGGGIFGFSYYGIIRESNKEKLWKIDDIQTIYGTSIGSVLATILCLKYDWKTIDDYLLNRPWNKVFQYDITNIFNSIHKNGIYSKEITEKIFKPLLLGKDLSTNITMIDFYKKTNIELHIFVTNVNTFKMVDISYKTHPNWLLLDAIHASCSIPILYQPICIDNIAYCDGGFCNNYAINECIINGAKNDEILGINMTQCASDEDIIMTNISLFDFIVYLLNQLLKNIVNKVENKIKYYFILESDARSLTEISNVANDRNIRKDLIDKGIEIYYNQIS